MPQTKFTSQCKEVPVIFMASNFVPMLSSSPPPLDDCPDNDDDDDEFGTFSSASVPFDSSFDSPTEGSKLKTFTNGENGLTSDSKNCNQNNSTLSCSNSDDICKDKDYLKNSCDLSSNIISDISSQNSKTNTSPSDAENLNLSNVNSNNVANDLEECETPQSSVSVEFCNNHSSAASNQSLHNSSSDSKVKADSTSVGAEPEEIIFGDIKLKSTEQASGSENLEKESKNLDKESENLDKESENLDKESENLDKESENLDKESENLDKESENLNKESENLNNESGNLNKESENLNKKSENLNKHCEHLNNRNKHLDKGKENDIRGGEALNKHCKHLNNKNEHLDKGSKNLDKVCTDFVETTDTKFPTCFSSINNAFEVNAAQFPTVFPQGISKYPNLVQDVSFEANFNSMENDSKSSNHQEEDGFEGFQSFHESNVFTNPLENSASCGNNDGEFQDFKSCDVPESDEDFDDFQACPAGTASGEENFAVFNDAGSCDLQSDSPEFANFESASYSPVSSETLSKSMHSSTAQDKNVEKISTVLQAIFMPGEEESDPHTCDLMADVLEQSNKSRRLWEKLHEVEQSPGLRFHWSVSHTFQRLLRSVNVDYHSILRTSSVPIFASGLSLLEPVKGLAGSASTDSDDRNPSPKGLIPPVEFDWTSSGLVNPLDSNHAASTLMDLSFLTQSESFLPPASSSLHNSWENELLQPSLTPPVSENSSKSLLLEELMSKNLGSLPHSSVAHRPSDLTAEASAVLDQLPNLSFMRAKVLMFPISNKTDR